MIINALQMFEDLSKPQKISQTFNQKKSNKPETENIFCKVGVLIDIVFYRFTSGLEIIGPIFAISLTVFIFYFVIIFARMIVPYWNKKMGSVFVIFISCLAGCHTFYIIFHYFLAMLVKPGSVEDIRNSKYIKSHNPYEYETNNLINFTYIPKVPKEKEFAIHIHKPNITKSQFRTCNFCQEIKPARAHHCTICGYCVLKKDHHCPWINNCVGQNNHRYFILFLFHLFLGCVFFAAVSFPIFILPFIKDECREFPFVCVLSLVGCALLAFLNIWNWLLLVQGNTSTEFWGRRTGWKVSILRFSFNNWRDNLFIVFGTKSLFSALFIPSIKKLPFSGLEWSRVIDPEFKINGILNLN